MMVLADVGNSRIKWVLYQAGQFQQYGQMAYQTAESIAVILNQWRDLPQPSRIVIVSVAGAEIRAVLEHCIRQHWAIEAEFIHATAAACGVSNAYAEPQRLGADRWVALIAARALTPQNCYVVDCGTALTIDALAADGRHLGGVIIPGITLMRQALYRETRQIPSEPGEPRLFGQSTRDAVWGGSIYAVAAAIDGITQRMMAASGPGLCVLTGGGAEAVMPHLLGTFQWEPDLVFHGLRVLAENGHVASD
jgi:type III pantothenate kinase